MQVELLKELGLDRLGKLRSDAEHDADRLPALLTEAERVALTVHQGTHGRRRPGPGETFWQFRAYESGESASNIDWRQSARSQQLFVRELEWEAAQSVWIWLDQSPSMGFRADAKRPFKADRAIVLALALTALLTRAGERVALLGSGRRPAHGRFGQSRFFEDLANSLQSPAVLPPAIELPSHARIVLISDFLSPPEDTLDRLRFFANQGSRAVSLQINDPVEEDLPFDGRVLFEGVENDGNALFGQVSSVRERYRQLFSAQRETLRSEHARQGWTFGVHRTDASAPAGLMFLHQALGAKDRR